MATSTVSRLAPVTARDGVDTRNQDNWESAAAVNLETTSMGATRVQGGQTAALTEEEFSFPPLAFLVPPGADVSGTRMNVYWRNFLATADRYTQGDDESFRFTPYAHQQAFNEREIERECQRLGGDEEAINLYRQAYNTDVVSYMTNPCQMTYDFAMSSLASFHNEVKEQKEEARKQDEREAEERRLETRATYAT
jgi:hypothetical protein